MSGKRLKEFFNSFPEGIREKSLFLSIALIVGTFGYISLAAVHYLRQAAWFVFIGDGLALLMIFAAMIFLSLKHYNVSFSLTAASYLVSLLFQNVIHVRNEPLITPITQIYISIVVIILGMLTLSYFAVRKRQFVAYYAGAAALMIFQTVFIYRVYVPGMENPRAFAANLIIPLIDLIGAGIINYFIFHYFQKITKDLESRNLVISRDNETLETAVRERTTELERATHNLHQFAKVSSHDLKEHLRIMTSFMELVERKVNQSYFRDEEMKRFVEFAIESGRRMDDIINGLLEYINIDMKNDLQQTVDANDIVRAVIEDLQTTIHENSAVIEVSDLPEIAADTEKVYQVFYHLIYNGIKYRKDETAPVIRVSTETVGEETVFVVRDNGRGIDADYLPKVFELFQRLHMQGKFPGSGIGLALCKKIVEYFGGRIWAESTPGEGSVFRFTLPLVRRN